MEFRSRTLDNGLEVIAECNDNAYSTALGFFVKTGARDEWAEVAGVSHFLEHMAFKGTPTRSAADVNRELDELGSHCNAYTAEEQTVYYAVVLPEFQDRTAALLADIMRPSLREADFETEKQVIIEEIRKYDDQPPYGAYEKCMAAHFNTHPLGQSVLGTVETVEALSADAMRDYFRMRYSPGNMTLVATGRVDFDRLVAEAQRDCGHWEPFDAARDTAPAVPHETFQAIEKEIATQQYAVQIATGPAADDEDRFANRLLSTILGDESGSRLYWELVEPGLAEYACMTPYEFDRAGITMTAMCCPPEQASDNLQRILDMQRRIETDGIELDELELAKSKVGSRIVLASERAGNRLFAVGNGWIQRRKYRTVRDVVDTYRAVTPQEVQNVLAKYPVSRNATVVVGPTA